jgi:hypothetical protein
VASEGEESLIKNISLDREDQTLGGREGVVINLRMDKDGELSEALCPLNELGLLPLRRQTKL